MTILREPKIDEEATNGLLGVNNSLAYRVHEAERHLHSYENWYEAAASVSGTNHVADRIGDGGGAFQVDAGNDEWGNWVQILGLDDTPAIPGSVKFDLHRFEFSASEANAVYFFQIGFGISGTAAINANDYTEAVFKPASNQIDSGPVTVQSKRHSAGTFVWARCKCPGENTATLDFYVGLHEYEG